MKGKMRSLIILIITIISLVGTTFATIVISHTIIASKNGKFITNQVIYSDDYANISCETINYSYYGLLNKDEDNLVLENQATLSISISFDSSITTMIGNTFNLVYELNSNNDFYSEYLSMIKLNDDEITTSICEINAQDTLNVTLDFIFNEPEGLTKDAFYSLLKNTTFNLSLSLEDSHEASNWSISTKASIKMVDKTLDYLYQSLNNSNLIYDGNVVDVIQIISLSELSGSEFFNVSYKEDDSSISEIINVGNYTIVVSNGETSKNISLQVSPKHISTCMVETIPSYTYTGSSIEPQVSLSFVDGNSIEHVLDSNDYDVYYSNNINAGIGIITFVGKGNYTGTMTANFDIEKATYNVTFPVDLIGYVGLTLGDVELPINPNGTFTFKYPDITIDNRGIASYPMVFTPTDLTNYEVEEGSGSITIYELVERPEQDTTTFTYNGKDQTYTISENSAYTINGENLVKKNAGEYPIRIYLNDYYMWNDYSMDDIIYTFTINKKDLMISGNEIETDFMTYYDITSSNSYTVSGLETVDSLADVIGSVHCTSTYKAASDVGTYTLVITTEKTTNDNYNILTTAGQITVVQTSLNDFALSLSENSYTYTGGEKCPTPNLDYNGYILSSSFYDVEYLNNINVGTATIRVTGKGNFKDTVEANYTISKADCSFDISIVYPRESYYITTDSLKLSVNSNAVGAITIGGSNYNISYGNNLITLSSTLVVGTNSLNYTFTSNDTNINNYTVTDSINYTVYATVLFVYETNTHVEYVPYGNTVSQIEPFEVYGYEFDNWYVNNVVYNFSSIVTSNLTIEARYNIITYTVTYILNSGTIDGNSAYSETYTVDDLPYSVTSKIPLREYYLFEGWFDTEDFDNEYAGVIISTAANAHSFNVYAKWIYDGAITVDHVTQTNATTTYNKNNQTTNLIVYSDTTTVIDSSKYTVIYMLDGVETTPNIAGVYTIKLRFNIAGNINDVDIDNTFTINKKQVTINVTGVPDKTYDGTTGFNDYSNLTYAVNGVISGDTVNVTFTNGTYNNKNVGTRTLSLTVTLSGASALNYTTSSSVSANGVILRKQVTITGNLTLATAVSINYSSPMEFNTFIAGIAVSFDSTVDSSDYTIVSMYDNTFMYGAVVSGVPYKYTSSNYRYVAGSTYIALVQVSDNYELLGTNEIYVKYKTAKVGSTFYTIEDAIASSGTTAITFAGNETSIENDVQITSFSRILSTTIYANSHALIVSHQSFGTGTSITEIKETHASSFNVVSVLYIPEGITINATGSIYSNAAMSGVGETGNHGVIMNDGTINQNSGTLYSYGYIKGNGEINIKSGASAYEVLKQYDYPGSAKNTQAIMNDCFPMYEWILNNISCKLRVYNGATLQVFTTLYGSSIFVGFRTPTGLLIGKASDSNCMFKPTSASNTSDYVEKKVINISGITNTWNTRFTSNNQNQKLGLSEIAVNGDYTDSTLSISMYITFSTSTALPLPLSYTNIRVKEGSNLLIDKSSYIFLNGTSLIVEENSSITVNGSSFIAFDQYVSSKSLIDTSFADADIANKKSAQLLLNGTMTGTGYLGGIVNTEVSGAILNISHNYIPKDKIKYKSSESAYLAYANDYYIQIKTYNPSTNAFYTTYSNALSNDYLSSQLNNVYGWLERTSKIIFETNCSLSVADHNVQMTGSGYTITSGILTNLNRDYYDFGGWYIDEACTISALNYTIFTSTILYAKWTAKTYNINYVDIYDNEFASGNTSTNSNISTFTYDTNQALEDPVNGDYVFGGWYLGSDATNKINILSGQQLVQHLAGNSVTLYALWYNQGTTRYVITFNNSNSAISCPDSDTIIDNGYDWTSYSLPIMTANDNDYTVNIYFGGWYIDGETLVSSISSDMFTYDSVSGDYTLQLVARWENKNQLDIQFMEETFRTVYYKPGFSFTIPELANENKVALNAMKMVFIGWLFDDDATIHSVGERITLTNQSVLKPDARTYVTFKIGTNSYTTVNVTLTKDKGYTVVVNNNIATATAFNNDSKSNGAEFIVTVGSQFAANYSYSGNQSDGKATITGTNPTTNLTTTGSTYTVTGNVQITPSGTNKSSGCLLPNTLVLMADGTYKEIQYVVSGDMVMVFNHETGMLDIAPVTFNESEETQWFNVIHLVFDNGSNIGVISEHGFFDLDTMRYEYIDEYNYSNFIGHRFYRMDGSEAILLDAYVSEEFTACYSFPSYYHLNFFTDDILSMPGGISGLFNIFEYSDNLMYDQEKMAEDINTYGLFTVEEFEALGVTEEMFNAYGGMYLKVALGKCILTEEYLMYLIERYGHYTE